MVSSLNVLKDYLVKPVVVGLVLLDDIGHDKVPIEDESLMHSVEFCHILRSKVKCKKKSQVSQAKILNFEQRVRAFKSCKDK